MRTMFVRILGLVLVGCLAAPAWSQEKTPEIPEKIQEKTPEKTPDLPEKTQEKTPEKTPAKGDQQPLPNPALLGPPTESPPPTTLEPPSAQARLINSLGAADGCNCAPMGYWTANGGIYYMQAFFGNNPAFSTSKAGAAGTTINSQQNFGQRLDVAPLASLGYTFACGWGIRGRWFQYNTNGNAGASLDGATAVILPTGGFATPGAGSTVVASSNLRLSVYDLEATYIWGCEGFSVLLSAGARYASFSQNYQLNVIDPTGAAPGAFAAYHNFTGVGPTMALEARKQICNSCFALYANARGSILFGSGETDSISSFLGAGAAPTTVIGSARQTSVLPIGEIEAGAELALIYGRYRFFTQIGVVGQVWWGAGNASQGLDLSIGSGVLNNGTNNNFGLIGGVVRAGVNF